MYTNTVLEMQQAGPQLFGGPTPPWKGWVNPPHDFDKAELRNLLQETIHRDEVQGDVAVDELQVLGEIRGIGRDGYRKMTFSAYGLDGFQGQGHQVPPLPCPGTWRHSRRGSTSSVCACS